MLISSLAIFIVFSLWPSVCMHGGILSGMDWYFMQGEYQYNTLQNSYRKKVLVKVCSIAVSSLTEFSLQNCNMACSVLSQSFKSRPCGCLRSKWNLWSCSVEWLLRISGFQYCGFYKGKTSRSESRVNRCNRIL